MAFNEATEGAGVNNSLSRRYGVQGPPAPNIASELFPMLRVDDAGLPVDLFFLQGQRILERGTNVAAVAAQFSAILLMNPPGSNVIAIVERFEDIDNVEVIYGIDNLLTPGAILTGHAIDSRIARGVSTVGVDTNAAATQQATLRNSFGRSDRQVVEGPWVLTPGFYLALVGAAVNTAFRANFRWRERALVEGELIGAVTT